MNQRLGVAGHQQGTMEIRDRTRRAVEDHSVALIRLESAKDGPMQLAGSATLVKIGECYGLLTADHVWDVIERAGGDSFGIVMRTAEWHRFEYRRIDCDVVRIGEYSKRSAQDGPDLAFVLLRNFEKVESLASRGRWFYPLADFKLDAFEEIQKTNALAVVSGFPAEMTRPSDEGVRVTNFGGEVTLMSRNFRGRFDYLDLKADSGTGAYPKAYEGMSGGGCWMSYLELPHEGAPEADAVLKLCLCGVLYYEIPDDPSVGKSKLLAHGPSSIYREVMDQVLGR